MLLSQRPLTGSQVDLPLLVEPAISVVEAICEAVRRGRNVLVLGEPGSGRTTILQLVAHRLRGAGSHVGLVDGAPWETARGLVEAIGAALGQDERPDSASHLVNPMEMAGRAISGSGAEYETTVPRPLNEVDLEQLVTLSRSTPSTVLIDNLNGDVAHDVFGRFRDTIWPAAITWVGAADRDDPDVLAPPADVFWEKQIHLQPLSPPQVRDLIQKRIDRSSQQDPDVPAVTAVADRLVTQLRHPSPRAVIAAMVGALEPGGTQVVPGDPVRMGRAEEAGGRRAPMLLYELEVLGRPAHAGDPGLLHPLGISRARASQLLSALADAGLVRSFDHGRRKLYEPVPLP